MQITFTPTIFQKNRQNNCPKNAAYPNLSPLKYDMVSFSAMKKKEFEGIDFAVVEKFKAPICNFNSNKDFQKWAREKALGIANKNYDGRSEEIKIQRKHMLKEWSDYVLNQNDAYTASTALLILNAITKDLKPDNDKIPPALNKGVLADCINEIDENTRIVPPSLTALRANSSALSEPEVIKTISAPSPSVISLIFSEVVSLSSKSKVVSKFKFAPI